MSKKENKTNPVFFSFSWPQDGEQSFLHLHFCPFTHKRPKILRKQNKGYKWRHRQVDPCVFETGLHTVTEQNKAEAGYGNVCIYVARCSGRSKRTRNLGATKTSKTSFSFPPPSGPSPLPRVRNTHRQAGRSWLKTQIHIFLPSFTGGHWGGWGCLRSKWILRKLL